MHIQHANRLIKHTLAGLGTLATGLGTSAVLAASPVDIAILTDGPSAQTDEVVRLMKDELRSLGGTEFEIRYPEHLQRNGNWSAEAVEAELNRLLANRDADVIVTLGAIGSSLTAKLKPSTPIIAPFVIDAKLQGFPVTESGTTGVRNLHYLSSNRNILAEVERFQAATGARHIAVVSEPKVLDAIPAAGQSIARIARQLQITFTSVAAGDRADAILLAIPEEADGVFILPLLRLPASERQSLIDGVNARNLPSYTAMGRPAVEQGVLMGSALMAPPDRVARQIAIDIRDILLGRDAGGLPVGFDVGGRMLLNLRTARAIGFAPPFEVLFEADLVHEEDERGRLLTLDTVVDEALTRNLQYAIAEEELLSAGQSTRIARSTLLPQLSAGVSSQAFDRDLVGVGATRTSSAGISLSQTLYSESARANYHIAQRLEAAQSADLDGVRLDIVQQAAQGYLNVLVAKTQLSIQRDNLKVTRANLERAQFRFDIGATDRSEVHRFETALGGSRQDVANAQALYLQTMNQLNRILQRPIEEPFRVAEPGLTDRKVFGDARLAAFITDPRRARIFRDFLVQEALNDAPELVALDEQVAAQERGLLAAKRARYVPDIALASNLDRVIDDSGAQAPISHDEDWSIGVQFTLPLFQGSRLDADKQQARIELQRLKLLKRQFTDQIETTARAAALKTAASKTSIRFANDAAQAAGKTLSMVTDAYTRGTASDVDLIDAQNAALVAQLSSANANYQFLLDLMEVQRAIGFFDFFVGSADKEAWFRRLDRFAAQRLQGPAR